MFLSVSYHYSLFFLDFWKLEHATFSTLILHVHYISMVNTLFNAKRKWGRKTNRTTIPHTGTFQSCTSLTVLLFLILQLISAGSHHQRLAQGRDQFAAHQHHLCLADHVRTVLQVECAGSQSSLFDSFDLNQTESYQRLSKTPKSLRIEKNQGKCDRLWFSKQ